ncbi:MAG: Na(+)-translocating NADH-quinone reductase subunit C [Pseudohongiellaceae bacterium]
MVSRDSTSKTLMTALVLCVVCSVLVSSAAVILKPRQDANKLLDRNRNILVAAGLFDSSAHTNDDVAGLFAGFTPRVVDLDQARFLTDPEMEELGIDINTYDQRRAANDPRYSNVLSKAEDQAGIKRRLRYPMVYVVESGDAIETIVVPVSGYGLWGIMYGFLALDGDGNTVTGIGFYELKETPGLGAEITNPNWTAVWPGKQIYDANGNVALEVVRGVGNEVHEIDGLAGATLTSRGVQNLIHFWLGDDGFGPFLANLGRG